MRSKAWFGILITGIVGLLALGYLAEMALESSPELQRIVQFKTAFAQDFESRGVETVQLRKAAGGSSYHLLLARRWDGNDPRDLERLEAEIARYFVERFPEADVRALQIYHIQAGARELEEGSAYRVGTQALGPARAARKAEARRSALVERLGKDFQVRWVGEERHERVVTVTLDPPRASWGDLRGLSLRLEPIVRERYRDEPYGTLILRWEPSSGEAGVTGGEEGGLPLPEEVRFDGRGREVRVP